MGQVPEAAVVDGESLPSVEHLQVVYIFIKDTFRSRFCISTYLDEIKFWFFHGFEVRNFCTHP